MWTGQQFAHHNHGLTPAQATHAAHIANAVLRRSGNEGMAIATANKLVHRDSGGMVGPDPNIGGLAPSTQTMNPIAQNLIQRYSAMPIEKLTELGAMMGGSPQGAMIQRILQQKRVLSQQQQPQQQPQQPQQQPQPQPQPQQSAPTMANGGGMRRAGGGDMGISPSQGDPWWTRQEAYGGVRGSGLLNGATSGRADAIHTSAPGGAYIIPADVVAGLGEGNTLAGARVMDAILHSGGPYGIQPMRQPGGRGPPRPPAPLREAKGGGVRGKESMTPVALSHGEYVVSPEDATALGGGDLKSGHRILNHFVVAARAQHIKKLKKLPGPVKS